MKRYIFQIIEPVGYAVWEHDETKDNFGFHNYSEKDLYASYIPDFTKSVDVEGGRPVVIKLRRIFENLLLPLHKFTININEPMFYKKKNQHYINLFTGLPYDLKKTLSENVQNKIKFIWNHVKEVWCNGNDKQYKYVRKWIINMMNFRRNLTALYLRSKQGAGKSCFTEFLCKVSGKQLATVIGKPSDVLERFNSELVGKILVVFEEMPTASKSEWNKYSDSMKDLITGDKLTIEKKYMNSYEIKNLTNVIINTNNDAIRIEADDRRYACVDITDKMIGNKKYFDELNKYLNDKEVQEAFYLDCVRNKKELEGFNPHAEIRELDTEAKKELTIKYLPSYIKFIKDAYISKGKEIKVKFPLFYKEYVEWHKSTQKKDPQSKEEVLSELRNLEIEIKPAAQNQLHFKTSIQQITNIFTQKGWMSEADEIGNQKEEITTDFDEEPDERDSIIKNQKQEIEELKKQIEELKKPKQKEKPTE